MKAPQNKGKLVFSFDDKNKRGFHVRLLERGTPVPEDVIALDLVEKGGKPHISIHLTPIEANAIACGLLHTRMEYDNR